ncbi:hypothetical protein SteCoe_19103 [Stentor coeruleus]|uniref:Uncharacterized protein n=1 Tax=Stentor coeruleus TaxID=5963 RepID=A0A1R2BVD4_9CILI|nr:hypothetical protein SteCoe_19103 [Stentor coeruleus]
MVERNQFLCKDCNSFIDLSLGNPCQDLTQMLICSECVKMPKYIISNQVLKPIDNQTLTKLKEEIINSTCHPASQAYYFNRSNCKLICKNCNPNNKMRILEFRDSSPKYKLKLLLEESCNSNKYDKSYRNRWKNMLIGSAQDIYKCLVEIYFFDNEMPICTDHIEEAKFYDEAEFKFKCRLCEQNKQTCIPYEQNIMNLRLKCLNIVKSAKTAALNSYILNAILNDNFDKNFFYVMKNLNSEKDSNLSKTSRCILCYEEFGLGMMLPIPLHDKLLHEICCKCYYTKNPTFCPIDNLKVSSFMIKSFRDMYILKSKNCSEHKNVNLKFSYYKKKYPYNICCNQCICESCLEESMKSGVISCSQCNLMKNTNQIVQDMQLLYQLKFIEIPCDTHSSISASFFDSNNIKLYCESCKPIPVALRKEILCDKFDNELINKLAFMQMNSKLFTKIQGFRYFYPLIVKYRAYKFYESCNQNPQTINSYGVQPSNSTLMRFTNIIPKRLTSILNWYITADSYYNLHIHCKGELELSGLVIGRPISVIGKIEVFLNNQAIAQSDIDFYFNEGQTYDIDFATTVPISYTPVTLFIRFSPGNYCHGDKMSLIDNLMFNDVPIFVSSSKKYGNLENGGPIVGFKFINFHVSEAEDPYADLVIQ